MESIISDKKGETFKTSAEEALLVQKHTGEKPRISAVLAKSIASPKSLDIFASLNVPEVEMRKIKKADEAHFTVVKFVKGKPIIKRERSGKAIALTPELGKIVTLISSYIPWDDPAVSEKIDIITKKVENREKLEPGDSLFLDVNIFQLSMGKNGNQRKASVIQCAELLEQLAQIHQIQPYTTKDGQEFTSVNPLIQFDRRDYGHYTEQRSVKGRKTKEEKDVLVWARLRLCSLFLYHIKKRYCPLYVERLMDVWRGNQTEMFYYVLNDLQGKWYWKWTAAIKAAKETAKENAALEKKNPGEFYKRIREAKKAALVYKASAATIRSRIPTDYEKTRAQRQRFLPDLQKAISSLVEYGIITDETRVKNDKGTITVYFHYNPDFIPEEEKALQ